MNVILVDDEPLALQHLAEELSRLDWIRIVGQYRNPVLALEHMDRDCPQAVFLDIEMPGMNGIELAERIVQKFPQTMIVFATAYVEYAVKAFELSAHDYILKPIQVDRLLKTTTRLLKRLQLQTVPVQAGAPSVQIRMFRSLQLERLGQEPHAPRWRTLKGLELFSLLLQHRGNSVRKETLIEQLWADIEWKRGITLLYTAIYQIRKMLQEEQFDIQIVNSEEGYRLDLNGITLDVEKWERQLLEAPPITEATVELHQGISQVYVGDYLGEYPYLWAEPEKTRLRSLMLVHAKQLASYYVDNRQEEKAASHYSRIQSLLPHEEHLYFELMRLYDRVQDRFMVEKQYELLVTMLQQEFDVEPQPVVQAWFKEWKNKTRPEDHRSPDGP